MFLLRHYAELLLGAFSSLLEDAAVFSSELLILCMAGLILFSLATFAFLTQPALTKKDVHLLKAELKPEELNAMVNRNEFVNRFKKRTSLTASQLDQAFDFPYL